MVPMAGEDTCSFSRVVTEENHDETPVCISFTNTAGCLRWEQALDAYERGRDMDSVVRLCLNQLDQPHKAFAIVRESASR